MLLTRLGLRLQRAATKLAGRCEAHLLRLACRGVGRGPWPRRRAADAEARCVCSLALTLALCMCLASVRVVGCARVRLMCTVPYRPATAPRRVRRELACQRSTRTPSTTARCACACAARRMHVGTWPERVRARHAHLQPPPEALGAGIALAEAHTPGDHPQPLTPPLHVQS